MNAGAAGNRYQQAQRDMELKNMLERQRRRGEITGADVKSAEELFKAGEDKYQPSLQAQAAGARAGTDLITQRRIAETAAADRASREAISLADRMSRERIEGKKLEQIAENNGQLRLANQIAAANGKVQSAYKTVQDTLKKKYSGTYTLISMNPAQFAKSNPEQYKEYLNDVRKLEAQIVEPAIRVRDKLENEILGSSVSSTPPASTAPRGQVDPNNPLLK
jgi:hypothetical protein